MVTLVMICWWWLHWFLNARFRTHWGLLLNTDQRGWASSASASSSSAPVLASASTLEPWTFPYFSNRLEEEAAPEPFTCTSSPSPRYPDLCCLNIFMIFLQSRRHGQVLPAAYGEVPGVQSRSIIQSKEAKYKLVSWKNFILASTSSR